MILAAGESSNVPGPLRGRDREDGAAGRASPSEQLSSLLMLSLSALPWTYLLYSLILSAQLRSGCLTVFFSRLLALANQLETWTGGERGGMKRGKNSQKAAEAEDGARVGLQRKPAETGPSETSQTLQRDVSARNLSVSTQCRSNRSLPNPNQPS